MIVKMKKLTLLCTPAQQEKTLKQLRDLKVVHVEHVRAPEGGELDQARNHLLYVQRAKEVLQSRPDAGTATGKDPDQLVDTVWKLIHKEKELKETLQALEHERERITPFGDFDPREITKLNHKGLCAKLYELPVKDTPAAPEGVAICEINRDKNIIYVLAVGREQFSIPAHEVKLPDRSLSQIEHHIEKTHKDLEETEAEFAHYAGDKHLAEQIADHAADGVNFLEVMNGMGADRAIVYLKGFYPVDRENDIITAAEENGWGYKLDEVSDEDASPTLLRNPSWVKPIKAILNLIGVIPGYKELDVSAIFLLFLSIFFGILIGDAGYGLLFIGLTFFAKFKMRSAPSYVFNLLFILSGCTVIWGVLTGVYFGIDLAALPAPLRGATNGWLTGGGDSARAEHNVMYLCFIIGTVHIVLARMWNFFRKINSFGCLQELGWTLCTVVMFFAVNMMVLNHEFPKPMVWVLTVGISLIALSLMLAKDIFGLVVLVLDIIGNFVDIISYVRLYAVGAASFAIANAFNHMAIDALGQKGVLVGGLIAAIAIFVGHALNILLGAMGILVHGIRLNTLEFSKHAGVQWGGISYNPFRKAKENI